MVMRSKQILLVFALSSTLFSPTLFAEDQMVKSIMELRADVESLYTQIDNNKDAYKAQMKSYALQLSDNEAQINREETALKLTEQNIEKTRAKLAQTGSATEDLTPMVLESIAALKEEIRIGIPFKTQERIDTLTQIESDLKNKTITQEKALALTWASYDDMLRLTKEIGQFKQEIVLDGKPTVAKVVKIGSVMMFFATPDEKIGYVKRNADKYTYVVATDDEEREHIIALFDAMQKQIRTGYFTLPNALLVRGDK